MKKTLLQLGFFAFILSSVHAAEEQRTFSNLEGKTLQDRIIKYDFAEKMVVLEKNGRLPLNTFSEADRKYILHWSQVDGFKATLRFKTAIKRKSWTRIKHEQTIAPYHMDAAQIPGKKTPVHKVTMLDDYEEHITIYFEAQGYEITLRNQNLFPLENIVLESKIFYEQEYHYVPDDILNSGDSEYDETFTSNKVTFLSETIPAIISREEIVLHTAGALTIDHQLERYTAMDVVPNPNAPAGEEAIAGDSSDQYPGFSEIEDHERRRRGKLIGAWVRVGIKDPDGEMVWRTMTDPPNLADKVSWETDE